MNHVLTGDLTIIQDTKLRNLFLKGASYRTQKQTDWKRNDEIIDKAVDTLINWLSKTTKRNIKDYTEFKTRFMTLYRARKRNVMTSISNTYIDDRIPKDSLKELHKHFIVTVIDKASNNLVLICPKLYLQVICSELGINTQTWNVKGNDIYKPTTESRNDIINHHNSLCRKFQQEIIKSNIRLPSIYPIPKLHKNPYKFRFIAAATTSSLKPISILLDRILKHMKTHMKNYCAKVYKTKGIKCWWSIKSTNEFIDNTKREYKSSTRNKIFTGDFASMFTALKQDTIIRALYSLTQHCFNNAMNSSKGKYIITSYKNTYYSPNRHASLNSFDKFEVLELIDDHIKNSYVTFADYTFIQTQGTSMGSNASCSIADCVLLWHEFEYMNKTCEKTIARKLNSSCRYVDDFCTFSNLSNAEVMNHILEIYPKELKLEITSEANTTNFLDTTLQETPSGLDIEVFNKTDTFPFKVIKYCCSGSLVHSSMGYKVFYGELHRFARICSNKTAFETKVKQTLQDLEENQYDKAKLIRRFIMFCTSNRILVAKFSLHNEKSMIKFSKQLALGHPG